MSLPPALESEFELVEELPTGKIFHLYHVKDMRKGGADAVVRLLPEKFAADQSIVNRFHDFFARFNDIPNRRYIPSVNSVVGVPGKDVYVVEEYCPGVSLNQFVESSRESKTFITDVTEILTRVCEALHHAHQKSIYHLCVLPLDILIDEHDYSKVKLVGFAAQIFAEKGKIDYLSGESSRFVAPEVFKRGVFGPKADVYSLAVMIKELLPEFSQGSDLLDKALSNTLKDRFASARQFAANIKELSIADPVAESKHKVSTPAKAKGGLHLVLKIKTDPEGAEIWSNDNKLGITSESGLMAPWKPGTILEIKKTGYSTETLDLGAPPDNTEISIKLQSSIKLYTNPWGASVKVNGELLGTTTYKGLTVPWDKGEIVIEKDGYNPQHLSYHTPPSDADVSLELKRITLITPFLGRRRLQLLGYGLAGLVVVLLVILVFGRSQNQDYDKQVSELQLQLKTKDTDISRLTLENNNQQGLKSSLENQLADREQEIERLTQAEKAFKIDFDKVVSDLRSEIKQKDSDIDKMKQTDQEKSQFQTGLQKQLSDLRAQSNNNDAEISRLKQDKLAEQRLRNSLESQLAAANSELIKKGDEISRLKSAQTATPPPAKWVDPSINKALIKAALRDDLNKVTQLLRQGADPNAADETGYTSLMFASINGNLSVARALLKSGAHKYLKSAGGLTALDFAKHYNHTSLFPYLQ